MANRNHTNPLVIKLTEMLMRAFPQYDMYIKGNRVCLVLASCIRGVGEIFQIKVEPDGALSYIRAVRCNFFLLFIGRLLGSRSMPGKVMSREEITADTDLSPQESEIIELLIQSWNDQPLSAAQEERARKYYRKNYFGGIYYRRRFVWMWLFMALSVIPVALAAYFSCIQFAPYSLNSELVHAYEPAPAHFLLNDTMPKALLYDAENNVIVPPGVYEEVYPNDIRGYVVAYKPLGKNEVGITKYRTDILDLKGKLVRSFDGYYSFTTIDKRCELLQYLGGSGSGWGVMKMPGFIPIIPQKCCNIGVYNSDIIIAETDDITGDGFSTVYYNLDGTPTSGLKHRILSAIGRPSNIFICWAAVILIYIATELCGIRLRRRRKNKGNYIIVAPDGTSTKLVK